jgi:predicted AAA+ superfamily ATPase
LRNCKNGSNKKTGKPLILYGAKSVGKTWIAGDLGGAFFESVIWIDFEKEEELRRIFSENPDKKQVVRIFKRLSGKKKAFQKNCLCLKKYSPCS